jgi:hypothetical protein
LPFGIFSPVLVFFTKKNLATLFTTTNTNYKNIAAIQNNAVNEMQEA